MPYDMRGFSKPLDEELEPWCAKRVSLSPKKHARSHNAFIGVVVFQHASISPVGALAAMGDIVSKDIELVNTSPHRFCEISERVVGQNLVGLSKDVAGVAKVQIPVSDEESKTNVPRKISWKVHT
jgi:hypothetical protein